MRAFKVNVKGTDWASVEIAETAGKAKYRYLRRVQDAWNGVRFVDLACHALKEIPPTRTELAQREADLFNARYPVGTLVKYWTWVKEGEPTGVAPTRHHATVVSEHAVAWMAGVVGCVSLSHVEPCNEPNK